MCYYFDYNKDSQSIGASFANGTAELVLFFTQKKDWSARKSLEPGIMNVENQPLVEPGNILLPAMHLRLGLMKNSVKAMNREAAAFTDLREKFPRLSEAKLREGIFIGPQIRDLIKDEYFDKLLQGDEKAAWDSFKSVVKGFFGETERLKTMRSL